MDIVEEDPQNSGSRGGAGAGGGAYQRFWKALGAPVDDTGNVGDMEVNGAGAPSEDEVFESAMVATNSVWEVDPSSDSLVPSEQYWGALPQFDMLQPKKVFSNKKESCSSAHPEDDSTGSLTATIVCAQVYVFDFGTEMYVWLGKHVPLEARRRSVQLAKQLWQQGYDYTECQVNPLFYHQSSCLELKKADQRPSWTFFGQVEKRILRKEP